MAVVEPFDLLRFAFDRLCDCRRQFLDRSGVIDLAG